MNQVGEMVNNRRHAKTTLHKSCYTIYIYERDNTQERFI